MYFKLVNLFLFLSLYAFGQDVSNKMLNNYYQEQDESLYELKILSWNIFMLPGNTFKFTSAVKRSNIIVEELLAKDYDVICLQELFYKKAKKIITEGLKKKYPYQVGCTDETGFIHTNSGLWIFSKHPIVKKNEIKFNDCSGSDCMAKKGALMIEFTFLGNNIQLLNTHLQSGKKGDRDKIRLLQAQQIASDILLPNRNNSLQILCGDFNTSSESQKLEMLSVFKVNDGKLSGDKQYSWPSVDYDNGNNTLLDYIFVTRSSEIEVQRKVLEITRPWKRRCQVRHSLSDHLSIQATVTFQK